MKHVFSSHIARVGYDEHAQSLTVEYKSGKIVSHDGVPPEIAKQVMNAPSVGAALHEHVKGRYGHRYI